MMTVESSVVREGTLDTPGGMSVASSVGIGHRTSHSNGGLMAGREYTCSQMKWKRSLTEVDTKRRKAAERVRSRLQMSVIDKTANSTLQFEVEHFKLFGNLNKGDTEVHNTVPTITTVDAERDCIEFEKHRKRRPHDVSYNHFYECIMEEAHKSPTPSLRTPVSSVSLRTPRSLGRTPLSNTNIATPRSVCTATGSAAVTPRLGVPNS